jgi:hypothetical protein
LAARSVVDPLDNLDQSRMFGLREVRAAVRTSRQPCSKAGKARIFCRSAVIRRNQKTYVPEADLENI